MSLLLQHVGSLIIKGVAKIKEGNNRADCDFKREVMGPETVFREQLVRLSFLQIMILLMS